MLIRLLMHHIMNPHLIDKLIIVKGLPYEWIFKKTTRGDQLLPPWEPDVDGNIPAEVRALAEPISFVKYFQPIRHYDTKYEAFWDERTVWGLRLDYSYGPGRDMWENIVDFIDKSLPRGIRMPEPVMVAKDHKEAFGIYLPRRSRSGSGIELVASTVPVVDLRQPTLAEQPAPATPAAPVSAPDTAQPVRNPSIDALVNPPRPATGGDLFSCGNCGKQFDKPQALRMHVTVAHRPVQAEV